MLSTYDICMSGSLRLRFRMVIRALILLLSMCCHSIAQPLPKIFDFNRNLWIGYSGDHAIAGRWGVHFDAQTRRSDFGEKLQRYSVRPGVNYRLSERVALTLGYSYIKSYPYGDFPVSGPFAEHRIYEQASIRHIARGVRLQHRFRLEQRFVKDPSTDSEAYRNRVRYSLRSEFPLTKHENGGGSWYLPVYNEILLGIAPNYGARPFDQNRFFVGIGRSTRRMGFEVGYLNQFVGQRNGRIFEVNNTLVISATSTVPLAKLFRYGD